MNLDLLDVMIIGPAFLAGLLVLSTHVPLGREVLRRGIIFIDLAVAQMAGLGVIAAAMLGLEVHGIGAQAAAFTAAIAGALILGLCERRFEVIQEAIVGISFVLAATGAILLLANHPRGGEELENLLGGQILWVDWRTLAPAAVVSILVLGLWPVLRRRLGRVSFYFVFALSVTVSVQLVGVYLVFASLIIPALAVRRLTGMRAHLVGYSVGAAGYLLGLVLSAILDWPSGATIVWSIAIAALGAAGLARLARVEAARRATEPRLTTH